MRKFCGKHYWKYRGIPVFKESETDHRFDERFVNAPADCMLAGFFQSPKYFESIAGALRNELKELLSAQSKPDLRLTSPISVAVHVRRKDYLRHPELNVCGSSYYEKSMMRLRNSLENPRFFIFSDDPVWCRNEFIADDIEVVDSGEKAGNPLHDLHLMTKARHHIIANSSYSWWAAWIAKSPRQLVIAPKRWFAHGVIAPIEEKMLRHWETV